ncbi:hypothetical protein GUJ93_ZPchr0011g27760 [Zizania palustris]|uniref:Uncharacterized protein n=1 Tax=Zizania palustris TaxID=103762 RepID=A0A8J5WI30_ZIZPA|nr:hypothetical protein GUJ93_ZPchr0011g27760 [Zizania palustris]
MEGDPPSIGEEDDDMWGPHIVALAQGSLMSLLSEHSRHESNALELSGCAEVVERMVQEHTAEIDRLQALESEVEVLRPQVARAEALQAQVTEVGALKAQVKRLRSRAVEVDQLKAEVFALQAQFSEMEELREKVAAAEVHEARVLQLEWTVVDLLAQNEAATEALAQGEKTAADTVVSLRRGIRTACDSNVEILDEGETLRRQWVTFEALRADRPALFAIPRNDDGHAIPEILHEVLGLIKEEEGKIRAPSSSPELVNWSDVETELDEPRLGDQAKGDGGTSG